MTWVPLNIVDRSVMLALIETELQVDFNLLALVRLENVTLLSTHEILERGGIGVILETGATKHLRDGFSIDLEVLNELQLFCRAWLEVSLIPPEKATVSRCGNAFDTRLTSNPINIIDWVVVRLL